MLTLPIENNENQYYSLTAKLTKLGYGNFIRQIEREIHPETKFNQRYSIHTHIHPCGIKTNLRQAVRQRWERQPSNIHHQEQQRVSARVQIQSTTYLFSPQKDRIPLETTGAPPIHSHQPSPIYFYSTQPPTAISQQTQHKPNATEATTGPSFWQPTYAFTSFLIAFRK